MIENAYRKVRYYDLSSELNLLGGGTLVKDVSGYRWPKAFAVRIGVDDDGLNVTLPLISATYYNSAGSQVTLTQQIATGGNLPATTAPNSAKSVMGNSTNSGFSTLVLPANSNAGHTLCKAPLSYESWLWYPYRLVKLTCTVSGNAGSSNTGLLLLF
jgi:hypothetical protein